MPPVWVLMEKCILKCRKMTLPVLWALRFFFCRQASCVCPIKTVTNAQRQLENQWSVINLHYFFPIESTLVDAEISQTLMGNDTSLPLSIIMSQQRRQERSPTHLLWPDLLANNWGCTFQDMPGDYYTA